MLGDRFDPSSPMGTRQWWDYQLAYSWEQNGGPAQTSYFMKVLIDHLPLPEQTYLRTNLLSILDCGCAMGDGVAILGQAFPLCRVAGLDVAQSAIESAQARYPQHEFILTEEGEIPRPFDVVLTSNVLEHFEDPLMMARRQAVKSRLLYLVLVPFEEYPLMDGHFVTFTENSFPDFLGGLVRLSVTTFETDPEAWAGKQILAVYASPAYLRARQSEGSMLDSEQAPNWEVYFQSPPESRALLEDLAARCARAETSLDEAAFARNGPARNEAVLVKGLMPGKVEKLKRLRQRWAPHGTQRRKWLNRFVAWLLSKV